MVKKDISALLNEEISEANGSNLEYNLLSNVQVTQGALNKANRYAKLVCDVFQDDLECYGYLIKPKERKDRIVTEAYLASGQVASHAGVSLGGEEVIKAGKELDKLGYSVLGWWHSHAMYRPFHSYTDDKNMITILNEIAPINFLTIYREKLLNNPITESDGNSLYVYDKNNPNRKIVINLNDEKLNHGLSIKNIKINNPIKIGFSYSMVVNAKGDKPYTKIATREFCSSCYGGKEEMSECGLVLVEENDICLDDDKLRKEIKKKVERQRNYPSFWEIITNMFNRNNNFENVRDKNGKR